jgi:hypothetical protein
MLVGYAYADPDLDLMDASIKALQASQDSAKRADDSIARLPGYVEIPASYMPSKVVIWGHVIDSLQNQIDSVNKRLLINKHYKQMLLMSYTVDDKIKYLRFLFTHSLESKESIKIATGQLIVVMQLEIEQIRWSMRQTATKIEDKPVLFRNIKKYQQYLQKMVNFSYNLNDELVKIK